MRLHKKDNINNKNYDEKNNNVENKNLNIDQNENQNNNQNEKQISEPNERPEKMTGFKKLFKKKLKRDCIEDEEDCKEILNFLIKI